MGTRRVTHSEKDEHGNVVGVCWASADGPQYVSAADVIDHIVTETHRYFIAEMLPPILILAEPPGNPTYLATEPNEAYWNNLDTLQDCPVMSESVR